MKQCASGFERLLLDQKMLQATAWARIPCSVLVVDIRYFVRTAYEKLFADMEMSRSLLPGLPIVVAVASAAMEILSDSEMKIVSAVVETLSDSETMIATGLGAYPALATFLETSPASWQSVVAAIAERATVIWSSFAIPLSFADNPSRVSPIPGSIP